VISRILNQEAKKQLGKGYGSPESPDCSGIELADLEKIDLTGADFTDFYNEVVIPNIKIPDLKTDSAQIQEKAEDIARTSPGSPDEKKGFSQEALKRLD
jgi:conjugal transfer mating pair stabilization protein TraN